jgi:Raf kinase inhibitor-like YbhB/YbcL family protein
MKKFILFIITIVIVGSLWLYFNSKHTVPEINFLPTPMKMTSTAFVNNGTIPIKYTCSGDNINPELKFENVPANAKSLVLILDDPDAPGGTFTHWVVYNITPDIIEIPEAATTIPGVQAKNSAGQNGYMGPCPPSGSHRYFFKLYALDLIFGSDQIQDENDVLASMQGHVLGEAELMGTFSK